VIDTSCPTCVGRYGTPGMVPNRNGEMQRCPLCDGTAIWENFSRKAKTYVINTTVAAALGTNNGSLAFDDIDFELLQLMANSNGGVWSTRLQSASGRFWSNAAVNSENMFGTAERPFPIGLAPIYVDRKEVLNFTVVDRSGNANNAIQMALAGYDLFQRGYAPQR